MAILLAVLLAVPPRVFRPVAAKLSLAAPFNFTTEYRDNAWARYDALTSRLHTADIQLTGAMRVNDWLDLGLGVDGQYTDAKLSTAYPNLSPALPDGVSQLSGDGWDFGWTAGAQAHSATEGLREACLEALKLDRKAVRAFAEGFSWKACAEDFVKNLQPYPEPEKTRFWRKLRRLARVRRRRPEAA